MSIRRSDFDYAGFSISVIEDISRSIQEREKPQNAQPYSIGIYTIYVSKRGKPLDHAIVGVKPTGDKVENLKCELLSKPSTKYLDIIQGAFCIFVAQMIEDNVRFMNDQDTNDGSCCFKQTKNLNGCRISR